ncbi:MAG: hypothetical protein K9L57_07400 [Spirochaetaceae bacterium]|nr:hypothetical protein [Spirochaetaceae bacterium]
MKTISAIDAKDASQKSGIPVHRILKLVDKGVVFGWRVDGKMYVSEAVIPELKRLEAFHFTESGEYVENPPVLSETYTGIGGFSNHTKLEVQG